MWLFGGGLLRFWGGPALSEMLWRPAELGARSAPFGGAFSPLSACESRRRFPSG